MDEELTQSFNLFLNVSLRLLTQFYSSNNNMDSHGERIKTKEEIMLYSLFYYVKIYKSYFKDIYGINDAKWWSEQRKKIKKSYEQFYTPIRDIIEYGQIEKYNYNNLKFLLSYIIELLKN